MSEELKPLQDGVFSIRFSPNQKLPEGYRIVWLEIVEKYVWWIDENEYSVSFCNRFMARRSALAHWNTRKAQ